MTQNVLFHIILMAVGIVVLLGAGYVGKTDKGGKRLNAHKALGAVGIVFVLTSVVGLILTRALRPTLPHFFIAAVAIIFMLLTPVGGLFSVKAVPAKRMSLRKSHRFDAIAFFGLAGLAVIFGIFGLHLVSR